MNREELVLKLQEENLRLRQKVSELEENERLKQEVRQLKHMISSATRKI